MTELAVLQLRGLLALMGREVRRVLSLWTQTLLPSALTAILLLAVFGGALGERLRTEGTPYLDFILPGVVIMTVASQSFVNNSTSLFQAKNEGYIEDVLTSPLRPWQLAAGFLAGGFVRGLLAAGVVVLAAVPFVEGIAAVATLAAAAVLTAAIFSALGVATGVWAETFDQHSFVANLVVAPLALVAGVFYEASSLDEPWETLTRLDPLFYLVDAARAGVTGESEASPVVSLAVAALVALGALLAVVRLLASGWRLKP